MLEESNGKNSFTTYLEKHYQYKSSILQWVKKMMRHAIEHKWPVTYWCFDIHGTIAEPDYTTKAKHLNFYPYAKEVLQILTKREDVKLILFTSSYPTEIKKYLKILKANNIIFDYVNENPDIGTAKGSFGWYEKKPYFNVLFDDKAGFDPQRDWIFLFEYLTTTNDKTDPSWIMSHKEKYHKK